MPTSARWAVANLPKITVKTLRSAGPMRCPQASFEAQPRIARLLAPKMGIGPYIAGAGAPLGALLLLRFQLLDDLNNAAGAKARGAEFDKFFRILKR